MSEVKMRLFIDPEQWEWLKSMSAEARTRSGVFTTFAQCSDDICLIVREATKEDELEIDEELF